MLSDTVYNNENQLINFGFDRLGSLNDIVEAGKRYPYSLPVQAYLAKTLKQHNSFDYERFEKISAVLSPDRQWLYNYIQIQLTETTPETKEPDTHITVEKNESEAPLKDDDPLVISKIQEKPVEPEIRIHFEEVEEVELPGHVPALADDDTITIAEALNQVPQVQGEKRPEISQVEETEIKKQKPLKEEHTPVKPDLLEREILKEAIDKSIQKEVSEIQPDFISSISDLPEEKPVDGFQYWLNPEKKKAETREQKLKKIDALIEKFIKSEPRIVPKKSEFFSPANAAKQSVVVDEDLVSEPLALIFEKQGYFDKAIRAYEKLSLKIPEKRAYFAGRIEKIREIVRNIKNNKE